MKNDRLIQSALVWGCLVLCGSLTLMHYGSAPGETGLSPAVWPDSSSLPHPDTDDKLLIFLHPQCPCSRATLRQLQTALVHAPAGLKAMAVVYAPPSEPSEWTQTGLVQDAGRIPGMQVVLDVDGVESNRFGVRTSGHVMLYDSRDRLVFSGGITPARGHEGACTGLDGLIDGLSGRKGQTDRSEVFGCPIVETKPKQEPGCIHCESHGEKAHP